MSSEESKEPLSYDEVTSWCFEALKLYCCRQGLKVSGSEQELVAGVFDFTPGIVYFHYRMSTSCIHVTALLFRIEAANRNGPNLYVERVCAPFLQTKQPCSPSKSLRWFVKHLSSIKVVAL